MAPPAYTFAQPWMFLKRKTTNQCDLSLKGGEYNVGLGYYFSDNRIDSSSIWIWRHRRSIGGHCQTLIRAVLGYVRNLFSAGTQRKPSAVIANRLHGVERLGLR